MNIYISPVVSAGPRRLKFKSALRHEASWVAESKLPHRVVAMIRERRTLSSLEEEEPTLQPPT